ncbi:MULTISPECIES: hypothetical protein [Actinomadura]|uniref:Cytochrome C biogenesis protein transmembrane region n=1 Tax=Actinomadura litoris TaxID=2678616 RepID=A0A7K1KY47_9ACTN|nr:MULTISPECIES: hypothetical protein [Actinomadura]MBT2209269.1 hypothetical protein [Actinomadura sp. NEAU-AAG7]MUN36915.1 hypothetical protein [Actinomadura litoris]
MTQLANNPPVTRAAAPQRRILLIAVGALIGFALTVIWSAEFVDQTIGDNVANTLLGHDAKATPITGMAAGVLFALVSGVAGTFTACNIAAFSALTPTMAGGGATKGDRVRGTIRPLGLLAAGMIPVSALYGALVGVVGTGMPQFKTATGDGIPPRLVQAMIVYGVIGLIMIVLGLASAGVIKDPLAPLEARRPGARLVVMGVLIGGFLIGRPFPLFRQLFQDAADSHNPLYGAAAFTLQSLGNIAIMAILLIAIALLTGGRVGLWLAASPHRAAAITTVGFIAAGVFLLLYWDVRLPSIFEDYWYPLAPWV